MRYLAYLFKVHYNNRNYHGIRRFVKWVFRKRYIKNPIKPYVTYLVRDFTIIYAFGRDPTI